MTEQSYEVLSPIDVDSAVVEIGESWHKATQSIFDTANLLLEYSNREGWDGLRNKLTEKKILSSPVISMLLGIATNPLLSDPKIQEHLPPSYNSIYLLSSLDDSVIRERIKNKDISPTMQVNEARTLAAQYSVKNVAGKKKSKSVTVTISMKFSDPKGYKGAIQSAVKLLQSEFPDVLVKANI